MADVSGRSRTGSLDDDHLRRKPVGVPSSVRASEYSQATITASAQ